MTINKNYLITFFLMLTAVLTGKEILIFNEEILIVLTFSAFVTFAYINLGDGIANDLNERSLKIQQEFEEYYVVREEIVKNLITYHQKQLSLANEIEAIAAFSKNQVEYIVEKQSLSLEATIVQQIKQKLKTIVAEESRMIQDIQRQVLVDLVTDFNNTFTTTGTSEVEIQELALDDAIDQLEDIADSL